MPTNSWNLGADPSYDRGVRWPDSILLLLVACGPTVSTSSSDTDADDEEVGVQPQEAGAVYSPCGAPGACAPLPYCVFPDGEAGFCTQECTAPGDPSGCPDDPGDLGRAFCLDIGLPEARVCAIDCSDGLPCPEGMRCEEVETADGPQRACF